MENLNSFIVKNNLNVEINVLLQNKTWIHRGGYVDYFFIPNSIEELELVVRYLYTHNIEFYTFGHTSNTYILNDCNLSVVISTLKLTNISILDNCISCEPGVATSRLSRLCNQLGIAGFEGMIDLPGTVAAASINNSGCYNSITENQLLYLEYINKKGKKITVDVNEMEYSHRNSVFKEGKKKGVILRVVYKKEVLINPMDLILVSQKYHEIRNQTQEQKTMNLGSIFANINYFNIKLIKKTFHGVSLYCIYKLTYIFLLAFRFPVKYRMKFIRNLLLLYANSWYLNKYVSNKNINVYLWKDNNADLYFDQYVEMMSSVFVDIKLEINQIK